MTETEILLLIVAIGCLFFAFLSARFTIAIYREVLAIRRELNDKQSEGVRME